MEKTLYYSENLITRLTEPANYSEGGYTAGVMTEKEVWEAKKRRPELYGTNAAYLEDGSLPQSVVSGGFTSGSKKFSEPELDTGYVVPGQVNLSPQTVEILASHLKKNIVVD